MDFYLGMILPTAFNLAPKGWAMCNGQLLSIQQNQALFSLLGTYFGGDGRSTFALPDLRGRTTVGMENLPGAVYGTETMTLKQEQMPVHNHQLNATTVAGTGRSTAANATFGASPDSAQMFLGVPGNPVTLATNNVQIAGGGQAHANMQPYLVINYIIALQGVFPSRN